MLCDKVGDPFASIGSRIHPYGESCPAIIESFSGYFLHMLKPVDRGRGNVRCSMNFHFDATGRAHLASEIRGCITGLDGAIVDDDNAAAGHFHLVKDGGGYEHRVGLSKLANQLANLANLVGVETVCGFVENQQLRIVNKRIGQADSLAETF